MPLRTLGALALATTLALSACSGDDPEPTFAPSPSASSLDTSPNQSLTPSEENDPEQAARAWVEAQNEALVDGDTSVVRALSARGCKSCDGLIDPIERVYAAGGYFETSGWRVDAAEIQRRNRDSAVVNAAVTIAGGKTMNAEGAEPISYDADKRIIKFRLRTEDGSWLVSFIGFL